MYQNQLFNNALAVHDVNLSYLLLAQQMIREDRCSAGFRLGLDDKTMEHVASLSLPQIMKLSSSSQFICRLRIDSDMVMSCITKDSRIDAVQHIHTGIILSTELLDSASDSDEASCA